MPRVPQVKQQVEQENTCIAIEDCLIDTQQGDSELEGNLLPLAIPSWEGLGVGYASCLLPSPPCSQFRSSLF
ncbi:MAG: hypothetical protein ACLFSH_14170, partial [Phormidium sp.]